MKFCVDCKSYDKTGCHEAKLKHGPSLVSGEYLPITSYPCYEEREAWSINPFHCGKSGKWFVRKQ